jgi:hypothetical protein
MHPRLRTAGAGAAAALVWAALEPLDRRLFRHDYSDVAVLGKAFTRGPGWRPLGLALHALNGAIFGAVYYEIAQRTSRSQRRLAFDLALLEHLAFFPLGKLVDRHHPARGEPGVASIFSVPGFTQASIRHALFGAVLGTTGRSSPPGWGEVRPPPAVSVPRKD